MGIHTHAHARTHTLMAQTKAILRNQALMTFKPMRGRTFVVLPIWRIVLLREKDDDSVGLGEHNRFPIVYE